MATKNNPGKYDCYANAEPNEPIFVLLGRDKHAPTLVWLWSVLRELDKEKPEKIAEAQSCALSMIQWLAGKGGRAVGLGESALCAVMELIRAANFASTRGENLESTIDTMRKFFTTTTIELDEEKTP